MSAFLERGRLLAAQQRWDLAEKELRMAVAESPDLAFAHGLLAMTLLGLKRRRKPWARPKPPSNWRLNRR